MKNLILNFILCSIFISCLNTETGDKTELSDLTETDSVKQDKCSIIFQNLQESGLDTIGEVTKIPQNFSESMDQLDTLLNANLREWIKCLPQGSFAGKVHFGFGMYLRNNWKLWANSMLAQEFNKNGIYHPDYMSSILLDSYQKKVKGQEVNLVFEIKSHIRNQKYSKKRRDSLLVEKDKANILWLQENNIDFNKLKHVNKENLVYTCDSTILIRKVDGDKKELWTVGLESYRDTTNLKQSIYWENFGKTQYVKLCHQRGKLCLFSLSKKEFYIKKDSLKIPWSKNQKKLIFHPKKFMDKRYFFNQANDSIELVSKWIVDDKKYYEISIMNDNGEYTTEYKLLFDENYYFPKFEGCKEVLKKLKKSNSIIKSH